MIHDIDETLRALVRRDVLNGANIEVSFEAPTRDWSSRRNVPTLNLYLYDIHEDMERREMQHVDIRDEHGFVIDRRPPPRKFKLSYMVTAWTQRPEDEHRLLSAVLSCFLPIDALPEDVLKGEVADQPYPCRVVIGHPLPADRAISDVWSALGGELKASLDLIVTAPIDPQRHRKVGPPVLEEPRFTIAGETPRRRHPAPVASPKERTVDWEVRNQSKDNKGRSMKFMVPPFDEPIDGAAETPAGGPPAGGPPAGPAGGPAGGGKPGPAAAPPQASGPGAAKPAAPSKARAATPRPPAHER